MKDIERPWHASYDPQVPRNIDYEEIALHVFLDRSAAAHPNRNALIFRNYKLSYRKLLMLSEILAANLQKHGLQPGDRVSIMLPNLPQTVIAFWGVLKAGGIVVMTNPLYMETELLHQINDSGAKFMIALDMLWPKINALRGQLGIKRYFFTSVADGLRFPLKQLYRFRASREKNQELPVFDNQNILPWTVLLRGKKRISHTLESPRTTPALLQYTGGTTGKSKGVVLTHFNLAANVQQCRTMLHSVGKLTNHEVILGLLPYFHVYGLTVCLCFPTSFAATLLPFPRFVPKDILDITDKLQPTIFPGTPAIYLALMQQKDISKFDLSSINYIISGSAPMPLEGTKRFHELTHGEIIEGYGLTEASPVTHFNPLQGTHKTGSIGLPFPDTDVRIVNLETGEDSPPNTPGELLIKGPQVMKEYWNQPDATAEVLQNGWLRTGDIATMDEEGYFYIIDRKKDLIIAAGFNVYPREIEEVLLQHPDIREAAIIGVSHPSRGEAIKCFIVTEPGKNMTKADVVGFCRQKLAGYKVPRQVEFRESLPKSLVGKVLKRELRDKEQ